MNLSILSSHGRTLQITAVVMLYVAGLVINASALIPYLDEINYWDEIVYLATGKDLWDHGGLWPYPRGPVISFIYAAIYMVQPDSETWLLMADITGRFMAYSLLFVSAGLLGRELAHRNLAPALLILAVFTALPFFIILLRNPSYWVFTSFVSLTLWLALNYARTQKLAPLIAAGICSAMALMARPDVVFAASALIGMALVTRPWRSWRMVMVVVVMAAIPAMTVGGYIFHFGQKTGVYQFGGEHKLYDTFAASYFVLFSKKEIVGLHDFEVAAKGRAESARVFGSPKENNYSVFRAVARNPAAFGNMIWQNTVKYSLPNLQRIFGLRVIVDGKQIIDNRLKYFALMVLFFAVLGIIELFRRRQWPVLLVLLVWPADLGLYLFTTGSPDYFPFHMMVVLMLVTVGLWSGIAKMRHPMMAAAWGLVLAGVVALDWHSGGRIVWLAVGGACLLGLAVVFRDKLGEYRAISVSMLVAGLIIFNLPTNFRAPWKTSDRGAAFLAQARYLKDHYPPMTATFAHPGTAVVSAKMWWIGAWPDFANIKSQKDFLAKMQLVGMPLILIDPVMREHNIYNSHQFIDKYAMHYYRTGYRSKDGKFAVLVPKKHLKSKAVPLLR